MPRRDAHLDAMLRHLGAAYYESLHGRASAADVARARTAIEERLAEQAGTAETGGGQHAAPAVGGAHHHGRWHSRVRDVMTTKVMTVDRITGYKEIAGLLAKHHIGAVPVLTMGRHVAGMVSEDDLLVARDNAAHRANGSRLPWARRQAQQHPALTAGEMMTAPAITIHPDAPIWRAARLMHAHRIKSLPVVDPGGKLAGIVSRSDLLSSFLRTDDQIAQQVQDLLAEVLLADPAAITVRVNDGVVVLTSQPESVDQLDLIPVARRLIWDLDGVVDVIDRLGSATH